MRKLLYITKPSGNCDYDEIEFHGTMKEADEDARLKSLAMPGRAFVVLALGKENDFGTNKAEWQMELAYKNGTLAFNVPY